MVLAYYIKLLALHLSKIMWFRIL